LTAITVKAALARRLASSDQAGSVREIGEVEELSRQALADVRAAVSNYREVTLAGELARGRELLRAAGVVAELPTATNVIDPSHDQLLGWAVREGITNVARHAHATCCTVTLAPALVEIADDGVGGAVSCGNGLAGLRERVAAAGGTVEAGPVSPRGWRLRVSLEPASAIPR
jgi:two-component system sensor histidine kinase DesK